MTNAQPIDPSTASRPPGPRGLPFLGVGPQMAPERSLQSMKAWREEYGDVFRLNLPGRDMVVFCHPDHMEQILVKQRDRFIKGKAYDGVRQLVGDSVLTLEGDAHKARRRMEQPAFHKRSLKLLVDTMVDATARWFDRLRERMPEGGELEIHREMTHVTLEIVVECLFGRGFFERTTVSYEQLTQALELLSNDANGVPIPRWVPTPRNLRFHRVLKALNTDVYAVIAAAQEAVARGEDDGSLLQMLLRTRDADTGEALSVEAIRDEVITLFIAGHETTALTMTWFFDLVTEEPEVIEALRAEVDGQLGDRVPDYNDLNALALVRRVVDEVLRLRPPAPWIARDVAEPTVVGGHVVEPGDLVLPSFWLLHRHPDFWEDPERFDPDRFLPERVSARHRYAFLPFSTGTRICIGNMFSYVESAAIISELVRRCTWTRVGDARPAPYQIATLRPSEAMFMKIAWRA
ncbi:MAG: cytochrome P450 [Alphaproteobacteria bacterium]|nr:cytochrome P450 [Alphaproteobacteria bacterium]